MGILDFFRGSKDERIARRLIEEFRALGETRRAEYDARATLIYLLDSDGKRAVTASLYHLRHEIERAPKAQHDEIYRRFGHGALAVGGERAETFEAVRGRLSILLKDATYPAYIDLMNRVEHGVEKADPLVWRPIAADVIACCIDETEGSLNFLKQRDLDRWQVDADQVFAQAAANVRARGVEQGSSASAFFFNALDSYIAARILCEDKIRALPLRGLPVAVVPDRDTLFMVGSDDEEGIADLARLVANQLTAASRHISARPLILTPQGWQEFEPPSSAKVAFGNTARQLDRDNWSAYQGLLQKDLVARGEDVFVAELSVLAKEGDDAYFTAIVWSKGVDSIFPAADHVRFFSAKAEPIRSASWEAVLRVMGPDMRKMEGLPERYRVNAFPSAGQFVAMGAQVL
jgi:hypothetical protein